MTRYYISCKDDNGKNDVYEVPFEVYVYIKQLEIYISHPNQSKLLTIYPELSPENNND